MKSYQWILNLVDKVSGPMQTILQKGESVSKMFKGTQETAQTLFYKLGAAKLAAENFRDFNQAVNEFTAPGQRFQQGLAEVQALTGATTAQLDLMGNSARTMALTFGGQASDYLTSFKGILGELGPEIAQSPQALNSMGQSVAILSKSMGGDAVGAMQALTTGVQQFGAGLDTPAQKAAEMVRQMNIMAAGANAGAAEVPNIAAALRVAGVAASGARVNFTETNAAIQVLAQGGIKGAEAGTALRNVLAKLGEGRFLPKEVQAELRGAGVDIAVLGDKSKSFMDRLNELKKVQGDSALVSKLFGTENANAANILLRGTADLSKYEKAMTGSNAAVEAANILSHTNASRMERMKALWSDLGISAFKVVEGYLPAINGFGNLAGAAARAWPFMNMLGSGLKNIAVGAKEGEKGLLQLGWGALKAGAKFLWTATVGIGSFVLGMASAALAQLGLNVAMSANPIGAIVVGLLAVGTAVYLIVKHWDTVKEWLLGLGRFMLENNPFYLMVKQIFKLFPGIEQWFAELWKKVTDFFHSLVGHIKGIWDKVAPYLGLGDMNISLSTLSNPLLKGDGGDPFALLNQGKDKDGSGAKSGIKQRMDGVSGGGSKPQNIYITIQKFQDAININTTNMREGVNDAVAMLEEGLTRVVNGVSQGTGA